MSGHTDLLSIVEAGRIGGEISGQSRQISKTCFHEASHAVVQLSFGLPAKIQIGNLGGLCSYGDGPNFATRLDECPTDEQQSVEIIGSSPEPVDLEQVRQETTKILKTHWSLVETIASSLQSRIVRNGEEFCACISQTELAWMWHFHKEGSCA